MAGFMGGGNPHGEPVAATAVQWRLRATGRHSTTSVLPSSPPCMISALPLCKRVTSCMSGIKKWLRAFNPRQSDAVQRHTSARWGHTSPPAPWATWRLFPSDSPKVGVAMATASRVPSGHLRRVEIKQRVKLAKAEERAQHLPPGTRTLLGEIKD